MATPLRLQLSRTKGFNLQDSSRAVNGLPAVSVASLAPSLSCPLTFESALAAWPSRRAVSANSVTMSRWATSAVSR